MADSIVGMLQRLGWRFNSAGVLCQPPGCSVVTMAVFSDDIGDRYRLVATTDRAARDLWIRGADGQVLGTILTED